MSRYREDLAWLACVEMPVIVYCKDPDCAELGHVHLPNVKREAGSMLRHIIAHYDRLADWTFFAQGDPFDHARDFLKRLDAPYDRPTSLTQRYLRHHPPAEVKARDRVETVGRFEVRYGDATLKGHAIGSERGWYNPATWSYIFECPRPEPLWFGYGAMWAAPRSAIRARPLALWRDLYDVCDSAVGKTGEDWTDPPINPWTMEASWYYLFQDPAIYPHRRRWGETSRPPATGAVRDRSKEPEGRA